MAKFNQKSKGTETINFAGGQAYELKPETELILLCITSFVKNQFYRSEASTLRRLRELLKKVNPLFAAKLAIWVRTEWHMRSISHVIAGELAHSQSLSGKAGAYNFFNKIVVRPDDMIEILAYLNFLGVRNPTGAMKKGFAKAFGRFDRYQLGKYRGEGKTLTLANLAKLCHPSDTEKTGGAIRDLYLGTLRSERTWENKLSEAGSDPAKRRKAWTDLLIAGDLGYFALLRNLRNILKDAPELTDKVCSQLIDADRIKRSRILPFRYVTARKQLQLVPNSESRKILSVLSQAVDLACMNVPKMQGKNLIALDVSMSMRSNNVSEIAGLFAAVLAKALNADIITFATRSNYVQYNPDDSTLTLADGLTFSGGGTNFASVFNCADKGYDRIFLLSDMQAWMLEEGQANSYYVKEPPQKTFPAYCKKFNVKPAVYSIDLTGYGTSEFPERNIFCLGGFSEKLFDMIAVIEEDRNALIDTVEQIRF